MLVTDLGACSFYVAYTRVRGVFSRLSKVDNFRVI